MKQMMDRDKLIELFDRFKDDIWIDTDCCPSLRGISQARPQRMKKKHALKRQNDEVNENIDHYLLSDVLKWNNVSIDSMQLRECLETDKIWNKARKIDKLWNDNDFLLGVFIFNEQYKAGSILVKDLLFDKSYVYQYTINLERISISRKSRLEIDNGLRRITKHIDKMDELDSE